ncbi:GNAT family N-acetyltransferase [Streptomyces sp. CA-132043]|uniref:GNAT family N-acetyltransferase n=1 Tax=Streptomyces sp. CA-132043 TaxID=3240048 RepID=UPI003D917815
MPTMPPATTGTSTYVTSLADSTAQVRAAQRLRHLVFGEELGATLDPALAGHDTDAFDDLADHLIVTGAAAKPSLPRVPPLFRGYLRLGAWVCGAPAYDPEFDVADFFVVLDMEQLNDRYYRYFLGESR